jgi:hypothetical protein
MPRATDVSTGWKREPAVSQALEKTSRVHSKPWKSLPDIPQGLENSRRDFDFILRTSEAQNHGDKIIVPVSGGIVGPSVPYAFVILILSRRERPTMGTA